MDEDGPLGNNVMSAMMQNSSKIKNNKDYTEKISDE